MDNNGPVWILGPPRARTKWAVNLFNEIPGYTLLNHPSFGIYSPFWWRYYRRVPSDAVDAIEPMIEAGKIPVILRHQFSFSVDWILTKWPNSRFLILDRDIMEWLASVRNFKGGLRFLHKKDGEEQDLPPAYVGRELNPDWWEKAEWWQRAVAHYWAYMGAALEGYNPDYCQLLYTSNKSTIEDIRDQLSASWMEEAIYNVSTFKPSRLSCNGEFNRSDVENLFEFLNSTQSSPWVVSVRQLIK